MSNTDEISSSPIAKESKKRSCRSYAEIDKRVGRNLFAVSMLLAVFFVSTLPFWSD